jgi:hypothetical protein
MGESGSGKTTAVRTLDPSETYVIQVEGKDLPFRSKGYVQGEAGKPPEKGNIVVTDKFAVIMKTLDYISKSRPDIKTIIIDDFQYMLASAFMERINEKSFDKFNDIGFMTWKLAKHSKELRDDLTVVILTHIDKDENASGETVVTVKTLGKLVKNVVNFEGLFTIVIMAKTIISKANGVEYKFLTANDGSSTVKTPMGMFDELADDKGMIENDLGLVISTVAEYYS